MKKTIAICIAAAFSLCAPAQRVMTLAQCIDYAVSHNVNVKRYANNVEQQKVQLSTARNSRLPDLTAGASQSFNFGRGLNSENAYVNRNTQSTGFNLQTSVPLLTGGRTKSSGCNCRPRTCASEHCASGSGCISAGSLRRRSCKGSGSPGGVFQNSGRPYFQTLQCREIARKRCG